MLRIEFQTRPDGVLRRLHEDGGSFTVDSVLQVDQDRWLTALTATGYPASPRTHFQELPGADPLHVQPLAEDSETYHVLLAVELSGSFIVQTLVRNRAIPHMLRLDSHLLEGVVTVEDWDHLRDLASAIEAEHHAFELLSVTQVDRMGSLLGNGRFKQTVGQELTPEQVQTLEAAYQAGYFEVPQSVTAGEVADQLGVSQSTFSERLRYAVTALLEVVFGDPSSDRTGTERLEE